MVGGVPVGAEIDSSVAGPDGTVTFGGLTLDEQYTAFGHGGTQTFVASPGGRRAAGRGGRRRGRARGRSTLSSPLRRVWPPRTLRAIRRRGGVHRGAVAARSRFQTGLDDSRRARAQLLLRGNTTVASRLVHHPVLAHTATAREQLTLVRPTRCRRPCPLRHRRPVDGRRRDGTTADGDGVAIDPHRWQHWSVSGTGRSDNFQRLTGSRRAQRHSREDVVQRHQVDDCGPRAGATRADPGRGSTTFGGDHPSTSCTSSRDRHRGFDARRHRRRSARMASSSTLHFDDPCHGAIDISPLSRRPRTSSIVGTRVQRSHVQASASSSTRGAS